MIQLPPAFNQMPEAFRLLEILSSVKDAQKYVSELKTLHEEITKLLLQNAEVLKTIETEKADFYKEKTSAEEIIVKAKKAQESLAADSASLANKQRTYDQLIGGFEMEKGKFADAKTQFQAEQEQFERHKAAKMKEFADREETIKGKEAELKEKLEKLRAITG